LLTVAGAVGYVSNHEPSRTIVEAIRTNLADKTYLSQNLTELMVQREFVSVVDLSRPPVQTMRRTAGAANGVADD